MAKFHYRAIDAAGQPTSGEVSADSEDAARIALARRGETVESLRAVAAEESLAGRPLSWDDATRLVEQVADLSAAELPLASGLRALAEDAPRDRLAPVLRQMAVELERGRSLDEALQAIGPRVPAHFRALLGTSVKTGRVGETLRTVIGQQQVLNDLWRGVWLATAYPALIMLLLVPLLLSFSLIVMPMLQQILIDFELELPANTQAAIWMSEHGVRWLGILAVSVGGILALVRGFGGRPLWHQLLAGVPLFGRLFRWIGLAEFARLLRLLLQAGLPLPTALGALAPGLRDAHLARVCHDVADSVAGGQSLAASFAAEPSMPDSLVTLLQWGDEGDRLPEALEIAGQTYEQRARLQSQMISSVLPPFVFLLTALTIAFFVGSMLTPLVKLISSIT